MIGLLAAGSIFSLSGSGVSNVLGLNERVLSLPMPDGYWKDRSMTLQQALITAEVHTLSKYDSSSGLETVKIQAESYDLLLFIIMACLEGQGESISEEHKGSLEQAREWCKDILAKQQFVTEQSLGGLVVTTKVPVFGLRGLALGELRKELLACPGMTQQHFTWIQEHKGDFEVVSAISTFINAFVTGGDLDAVDNLFSYLDKQLQGGGSL